MQFFQSDGIRIAFLDEGEGEPIVLVHGFASSARVNWVEPGWVADLREAGFRVIAIDDRGHGESEKLYDPYAYTIARMAGDVSNLLDHLRIGRADVMGYSMGARISTRFAVDQPERVRSLVLGGVGTNLMTGMRDEDAIEAALLAPDLADVAVSSPGRIFRRFADRTKSDRRALAACITAPRQIFGPEDLARLAMPTLIAWGTKDPLADSVPDLAGHLPHAELLPIENRDHMTVVGERRFRAGVIDFLARRP